MYRGCQVAHIVAVGKNNEIGVDGGMLWHIPEDFGYFKQMTIGNSLIMGRKTYEGISPPLTRRCVHVVGKNIPNPTWSCPLRNSLSRASDACHYLNTNVIFVAGGSMLYNTTEDIVDILYITRVPTEFENADSFYNMPKGFVLEGEVKIPVRTKYGLVRFEKWVREYNGEGCA